LEKISWSERVKNEEVLHKSQGGKEYPTYKKQRKANWIGRILTRNCLLKYLYVMEGQPEGTGRRERACKLKDEAQDRTLRITRFGRGYGFTDVREVTGLQHAVIPPGDLKLPCYT